MSHTTRPDLRFIAGRLLPSIAVLAVAVFLTACPKKEWQYTPPPPPATAPSKTFDAQYDPSHLDANGSPQNVDWHPQLSGTIPNPDKCNDGQPYSSPNCTLDTVFRDKPDGINEAFCFIGKAASGSPIQPFFGHADWMISQFSGSIGWFNFGDDWDYGLMLIPGSDNLPPIPSAVNEHGITTNNNHVTGDTGPQYIEMEFNSSEVDAAFTQGWWNDFKMDGHNNDASALAQLFHPNQPTLACGSAVGLFGLDCDHGCRSELHPIYGIAIQRTEDPNDNEWSVMARNWGTGGYCSQYNDEVGATNISINLPYTSSQPPTSVQVQDFTSAANNSSAQAGCPSVYFQNGQTLVNLTLPPPEQEPVASFTLKLQWPAGAKAVSCTQPNVEAAKITLLSPEHATVNGPMRGEDYMGSLLRSAAQSQTPGIQRPELEKDILPAVPQSQIKMQSLSRIARAQPAQPCDGTITVKTGIPLPAAITTVHKLKIDSHKQVRDQATRNYICHAYRTKSFSLPPNTTQQDFDTACKGVK